MRHRDFGVLGSVLARAPFILALAAGCSSSEDGPQLRWKTEPVKSVALLLPGQTAEGDSTVVGVVWVGDDCVGLDHFEISRTLTGFELKPWGLRCSGCGCSGPAILNSESVTLEPLPAGTNVVRLLAGEWPGLDGPAECVLEDTLRVPSSGDPGAFTFDILVINCHGGEPWPFAEVMVWFREPGVDTAMVSNTDNDGRCHFKYAGGDPDTLTYTAWITPGYRYPWRTCVRGIPERMVAATWSIIILDRARDPQTVDGRIMW